MGKEIRNVVHAATGASTILPIINSIPYFAAVLKVLVDIRGRKSSITTILPIPTVIIIMRGIIGGEEILTPR